jgi:hypothetical protein
MLVTIKIGSNIETMKVAFQTHINKKKNHQKDKKNQWGWHTWGMEGRCIFLVTPIGMRFFREHTWDML